MVVTTDHKKKLRKTLTMERRPLMLKDYLRDDLSSCSSSGFKSFPRRQCCTTVRFLLEIDLKSAQGSHNKHNTKRLLQRSRSKAASKTISALQRASEALLHAVKQLQFPSVKSPLSSVQPRSDSGLLPRSLSRKLLKRSFWRKADREEHTIKRWKTFREYLEEQHQPSDQNIRQNPTTIITAHSVSTSSSSKSNSISNGWTESDFTADILQSSTSSGNSESSSENGGVESKSSKKKPVGNRVGVSVGEDSITVTNSEENTKDWRKEEDKEQFSPVSVLDCPFEDGKHINSPPFKHRLARMEGTKQKLMQKLRRFESLSQLEPVDLEKRIASSELQLDHDDDEISLQSCSLMSVLNNNTFDDKENETKNKARELLKNSSKFMCKAADNLLSDFFMEKITESNNQKMGLLKEAEDWINGKPKELLVGWEVEEGRKAYVNDMEKNGRWRNVNEEKEEVGLDLELEVFTSLIIELVLDLF